MAVFVLGEDMEDMEDVLKLCLGLWWEPYFEKSVLSEMWTLLKF